MGIILKVVYCLICLIFGILNLLYGFQSTKPIEGIWQGSLSVRGIELRIVFKISKKDDGSLTATMDSPDQGAKDILVDSVVFQERKLHIAMPKISGIYDGTMQAGDTTIPGTWRQGGTSFDLPLKRSEKAAELTHRPQDPVKPYPYNEDEVSYGNPKAGIQLAGTLTLPPSKGPISAVLLITGSGPQDRDEFLLGHRPFLVLADYLTRQDIAVLRVDDRGIGKSTGSFRTATTEDFASDVLVGVEYLKTRKEIDSKKIGLIGHSEGGMIAPMVAAQSKDVAFIVLMAGPGIPAEEILYQQDSLMSLVIGATPEAIAKKNALNRRLFTIAKEETDTARAIDKLKNIISEEVSKFDPEEKKVLELSQEQIEAQIKQITSPWFRYFLNYDPKPTLMKVKCPVLAINGEKDLQVPSKDDLRGIEEALKAGGNKNYMVKELPGLNHLFQTAQTGSPLEYSKIEETMSLTALKVIGDWITEQTKANR